MKRTHAALIIFPLAIFPACGEDEPEGPPPCGSLQYNYLTMIPGPGEAEFDLALDAKARKLDRVFHAINAHATGLNADVAVRLADTKNRAAIAAFVESSDSFELAETSTAVASFEKSAGLYSGAGIAADAWRYGTLRDQGAACADIEVARSLLLRGLESMHRAVVITGAPGVIARSLARTDVAGNWKNQELTPLFDSTGAPLPAEKNNGTWRADHSGELADWIWEDSLSRDMLVGWAMAFGAAAEVIQTDPTISEDTKRILADDAREIGQQLMIVRESGFDLEIIDADGRTTFHGYLNENAFDRAYLPGVDNGFFSVMSLGIVAALVKASGDETMRAWLNDELIGRRKLATIARSQMLEVNLGVISNFSNYNMAFTGALLAWKYVEDPSALTELRIALRDELYDVPSSSRQPVEQKQSYFDFIWAGGMLPKDGLDRAAVDRGLETLREFPPAPFYEIGRTNCDEAEIMSGSCTLDDGTQIELLGNVGRGGDLVAAEPIPMRVRPPSNYFWRSNPYEPNGGGDGGRLLPAVDFRVAYWLGRWTRI
jgi:hypothetical protein